MSAEVLHILDQLSREKGIERSILVEAMKTAMEAAVRKNLPYLENIISQFNEETGQVEIFIEKQVVEDVEDENIEATLNEAKKTNTEAVIGDTVLIRHNVDNLGRIAAQLAKQVILQKVREAEIDLIYNDYKNRKGELINGFVQRFEHGDMVVELGKAEGILPRREQVFRETFNKGDRVRAYILDIRKTPKKATVILSRTHVGLVENLFQLEVPEISEGMVEIMGIVREPSGRTKIAVRTNDRDIDAVGACVGMRGMRVQSIVQELRGEKIDIVEYSEDSEVFIRNALSPAKISRIITNASERHMTIIVADDQMSLAIGKKGQKVRLAAKLVKWRIDIKGESDASGDAATPDIFAPSKPSTGEENFLEIVTNAKGFGEKFVALLFTANVVSFGEVIKRGVEGMVEVPGIGPKKAEAIYNFATTWMEENIAVAPAEVEEDAGEEIDESTDISSEEARSEEETESAIEEDDEEQDLPLSDLTSVDGATIELLEKSGFQTIAELSVTPAEELAVIEGIDDDEANSILEQAKQHMENFEQV